MASNAGYTPKLIAAYIPDRFQDYYLPITEAVQPNVRKMGSQILNETSLEDNPPPGPRRSSCLQVRNIPSHRDVEDIHSYLKDYGTITTCTKGPVQTDGTYIAYITFSNKDEAQRAYEMINEFEMDKGYALEAGLSHSESESTRPRYNKRTQYAGIFPSGQRRSDFPLRITVSSEMVGAIIGRGGATIRQITQTTRARVDIHRKDGYSDTEKVITIYGSQDSCSSACEKILQVIQAESTNKGQGEIPLKILAHNNLIGRLIGKGGANIKRIMEQTNAKITVSGVYEMNRTYVERIIAVRGNLEEICKAEKMITKKLRQCYESDLAAVVPSNPYMYPGMNSPVMVNDGLQMPHWIYPGPVSRGMAPTNQFMYANNQFPYPPYPLQQQFPEPQENREEVCVFVQNNSVGAIIGTSGSTIREMINMSGAIIKVTQPQANEKLDKASMRRVTITGTPDSQGKAQYLIFKKLSYECGFEVHLKIEILIPSSQIGRIIGKGGQRIRQLQNSTGTQMRIPEDCKRNDSSSTPLQITGEFYGSQAAQRHIRALIKSPVHYDARNRSPVQSTST